MDNYFVADDYNEPIQNNFTISAFSEYSASPPVGATYALDLQPLYYGATLMASKTNIEFVIEPGHVLGAGTTEASGTAGTTNASGIFQVPGGYTSPTADPVTVSLYWEEGSDPSVDRSLIVKTTLVAA